MVKTTTDIGNKPKVETKAKEKDQKLLDFIKIEIIRIEQQKIPYQGIITLPTNTIINSYFNKHMQ